MVAFPELFTLSNYLGFQARFVQIKWSLTFRLTISGFEKPLVKMYVLKASVFSCEDEMTRARVLLAGLLTWSCVTMVSSHNNGVRPWTRLRQEIPLMKKEAPWIRMRRSSGETLTDQTLKMYARLKEEQDPSWMRLKREQDPSWMRLKKDNSWMRLKRESSWVRLKRALENYSHSWNTPDKTNGWGDNDNWVRIA